MTEENNDIVEMTMAEFRKKTGVKPRDLAVCLGMGRQNVNHHSSDKSSSIIKYNKGTGEILFYTPEKTLAEGVLEPEKINLSKLES